MADRIRVEITGDAKDLVAATAEAEAAVKGLGSTAKVASAQSISSTGRANAAFSAMARQQQRNLASLGRGFRTAGLYTAGFAAAVAGFATYEGLKFNATMESNQIALEQFIGSTRRTNRFLNELFQTAKKTPFEFADVTAAARKFLAFGFTVKQTKESLDAVGNAVAALGGSADLIDRVVIAFGQIKAKGRVQGDELLQLAEAGIPAYDILREKLHLTSDEVKNIGNAGIGANEAIKALTEGMQERFGDAAKKQAQTFEGQLSTLKDNVSQTLGAMTEGLFHALEDEWIPAVNQAATHIAAIWKRDDLTPEEKFRRSADQIERYLGPLFDKLEKQIADLHLGDKLVQAFNKALPKIAEGAGQLGLKFAEAFVHAFLESDILGKLVLTGWLLRALGGWQLIGQIGAAIGRRLLAALGIELAAGQVAGGGGIGAALGSSAALAFAPAFAIGIVGFFQRGGVLDTLKGEGSHIGDDIASATVSAFTDQVGPELQQALASGDIIKLDLIAFDIRAAMKKAVAAGANPQDMAPLIAALGQINHAIISQFRDGWLKAGKINKDSIHDVVTQLSKLPPAAREKAQDAMVQMAQALEAKGKLAEGSAARLHRALVQEFGQTASDSAQAFGRGMASIPKVMDQLGGAINSALNRIGIDVGKALKSLGGSFSPVKLDIAPHSSNFLSNLVSGNLFKARGGYLGGSGLGDTVPVMAAPGEAFLNRHQQPHVEHALAFTKAMGAGAHGSLNDLFRSVDRPHYMAKGGQVPYDVNGPAPLANAGDAALRKAWAAAKAFVRSHRPKPTAAGAQYPAGSGPGGIGTFGGFPVANWIIPELVWATKHGWTGNITSGYRSHAYNVSQGRYYHSEHEGTNYPSGAVDFGGGYGYWDPVALANRNAFFRAVGGDAYPGSGIPHGKGSYRGLPLIRATGFTDWGHASGTGHARGGFVQRFAKGGWTSTPFAGSRIDKVFPKSSGFAGDGYSLPRYVVAALAESFGMPGDTMAAVSYNEMARQPGADAPDPPGRSRGLWAINSGWNPQFDATKLRNPLYNAWAAAQIGGRHPDIDTWHAGASPLGWSDHYTAHSPAEIARHLGGSGKDGGDSPDKPSPEDIRKAHANARINKRFARLRSLRSIGLGGAWRDKALALARFWHYFQDFSGPDAKRWEGLEHRLDIARTERARSMALRAILDFQRDQGKDDISGHTLDALRTEHGPMPGYNTPADQAAALKQRAAKLKGLRFRLANANTPARKLAAAEALRDFWATYGLFGPRKRPSLVGGLSDLDGNWTGFSVDQGKTRDLRGIAQNLRRAAFDPALKGAKHLRAVMRWDRWAGSHGLISSAPDDALRGRLPRFGAKGKGRDLGLLNELLGRQLLTARQESALSQAQYGVFSGMLSGLGGPFVGAFAHGGRVPRTGLALVHRDEMIQPDPEGPYARSPAAVAGRGEAPEVTLVLSGDAGKLVKLIDARVDGRAAKVTNARLGRQARRISVAPGVA